MLMFIKNIGFIFTLVLVSTSLFAQLDQKIKKQNVVPGSITRGGSTIEGYIIRMGSEEIMGSMTGIRYNAPWTFQKEIRFMEKAKFESMPKIKYKDYEKLGPSDIERYNYNGDSLIFDSQKYANLNNPGLGMMPKMVFLRRIAKHKISLYVHYTAPAGNGPEDKQVADFKESAKPFLLYFKDGEDNAKGVGLLNIGKQLTECPKAVERYKNREYKLYGHERSDYGEYFIRVSDQDLLKLYAIADFNSGKCD